MITSFSQPWVKSYRSEQAVYVDFITKGAKHMRELLADLLPYTAVCHHLKSSFSQLRPE